MPSGKLRPEANVVTRKSEGWTDGSPPTAKGAERRVRGSRGSRRGSAAMTCLRIRASGNVNARLKNDAIGNTPGFAAAGSAVGRSWFRGRKWGELRHSLAL